MSPIEIQAAEGKDIRFIQLISVDFLCHIFCYIKSLPPREIIAQTLSVDKEKEKQMNELVRM